MVDSSPNPRLPGGHRLPEQPTILIAGHHFFSETVPLAPGTATREIPALAALALEQESPFSEEQLACGHYEAPADGGMVVFAALRRKFAALQESWPKAGFVLPDFATWLPRGTAQPGIVVLETAEAVTALEYAAGSALPKRIVSRPVPAEPAGAEGVALAREQVLARLVPGGRRVRRFRLAETPCTVKGACYHFHWEALDFVPEKSVEAGAMAPAQLWAMDLRDQEFLATKRRDFQWNRLAWGALLGLVTAAALLVVAELGLLGTQLWLRSRQARIELQAPAARLAETNSDIVERLSGYIDRKPQPLEQLAYVNDLRPRSIYFTKVSVEGGAQMVIEGSTAALAEVNEFEAALKRSGGFASVEVKNTRAREGGGTFQLTLVFKAGVLPAAKTAPLPASGTAIPAPKFEPATSPIDGSAPKVMPGPSPERRPSGMPPSMGPRDLRDPRSGRDMRDPRMPRPGEPSRPYPPGPAPVQTPPAGPAPAPGEPQPEPANP